MNEADTGRKFVVPKLQAAGLENAPHSIAGRIFFPDSDIVANLSPV